METPRVLHEPLTHRDYLRILVLHLGSFDDGINCELKTESLAQSENTYAAITYVWGDPEVTKDIVCNAISVPITVNLYDALQRFREEKTARRLWADALCID